MDDKQPEVLHRVEEHIAVITLNRPARLNAWTVAMERELQRALTTSAGDEQVRAIVITGAGRGFCAGADMGLLQGIVKSDEPREGRREPALAKIEHTLGPDVSAHYGGRFGYLMSVPKPIIAAINGPCAGLGLVFALYCDLRFASDDAKFTTAFAQRGLIAEHGISWLLPRLVGPAHALDLLLSARVFRGAEAKTLGLVNDAFAPAELMPNVLAYARRLATSVSPRSLAVMKAQIWKSLHQEFGPALAVADAEMAGSFASADFKEGVAHFVEKRAPRFSGR